MPKKSRAASRIFSSTSSAPRSCANFSMPVRAIGRTNSGMFASLASAAAVHRTGTGSLRTHVLSSRNHRGERTLATGVPACERQSGPAGPRAASLPRSGRSVRRATGRPAFRTRWSASPSRSRTRGTRRRPTASRAQAGRRSADRPANVAPRSSQTRGTRPVHSLPSPRHQLSGACAVDQTRRSVARVRKNLPSALARLIRFARVF